MTISLLISQGHFSIFWTILTINSSYSSSNFISSNFLLPPFGIVQMSWPQLVLPSMSCYTTFFVLWQGLLTYFSFEIHLDAKVNFTASSLSFSPFVFVFFFALFFIFFFENYTYSVLLAGMSWSVRISKSQKILCVFFSWMNSGFCRYH